MNYKTEKRNNIDIDKASIDSIASKFAIHPRLAELLILRSYNTPETIKKFLVPDKNNFHNPLEMKGMPEAVERLNAAIENNECVAVYGDYDADGICSAAILSLFLSKHGVNVVTHIPDRLNEGYGVTIDALTSILEQHMPDLVLTCDCGITSINEAEYIKELGVDVIITDHHEVGELIPDCTVIDPHQTDCNYPFKELCGAGVAFKLIQALSNIDEACEYLDLVAVATIADLVPLTDENRLIVQFGLQQMAKGKNVGLKAMLDSAQVSFPTSSDIAFKIAPRINAAGRMGDPTRAFDLFTTQDRALITNLVDELNAENDKRKTICDNMYSQAQEMLRGDSVIGARAIVLKNDDWEKGVTGILAAKLVSDFNRPVFIIVNSGDMCRGTCRSIQGINVYELLSACSDLLIEFGGHNQAAGFSIQSENVEEFKQRINSILRDLPFEAFLPRIVYDIELNVNEITKELAASLNAIEPTGNGNPKPLLMVEATAIKASPLSGNYKHTLITLPTGTQIMAFNYNKQNAMLMGDEPKKIVFDITPNPPYAPRLYLRGYAPQRLFIDNDIARANFLKTMNFKSVNSEIINNCKTYASDDIETLIDKPFGILIIAGSEESYKRVYSRSIKNIVLSEFMSVTMRNNFTRLIVSPDFDEVFKMLVSNYSKIVFADYPLSSGIIEFLSKHTNAEIWLPKINNNADYFKSLKTDRQTFSAYFSAIKHSSNLQEYNILRYFQKFYKDYPDFKFDQFVFCLNVFIELGFVTVHQPFKLVCIDSVKRSLNESKIYNTVCKALS